MQEARPCTAFPITTQPLDSQETIFILDLSKIMETVL